MQLQQNKFQLNLDAFDSFTYPGGEVQTRMSANLGAHVADPIITEIRLIARIRSANDHIKLLQAADAVRNVRPDVKLYALLPYLPYGRADRRFTLYDSHGLQFFMQSILDVFDGIVTLDMHNPEFPKKESFFGVVNVPATTHINYAIAEFAKSSYTRTPIMPVNVLFPDKGARERYAKTVREDLGCNTFSVPTRIYHVEKERDPITGKLLNFHVPQINNDNPTIIVDDICDGGGTFIGIGSELALRDKQRKLGLYTTHGIFSQGTGALCRYFSRIYATDSFNAQPDPMLQVTWLKMLTPEFLQVSMHEHIN